MLRITSFLVLFCLSCWPAMAQTAISITETEVLPSFPAPKSSEVALGFAGMVGGMHNGVIIVAGGANFPDKVPWKGGKKVWSDAIYILEDNSWRQSSVRLPIPLAYGASVTTEKGILCMGGNNETGSQKQVFLMGYDSAQKEVFVKPYPSLPVSVTNGAAVYMDGRVYLVGGNDGSSTQNSLYSFKPGSKDWEPLDDFPGPPRAYHSAVIQETPNSSKIFVIGGRNESTKKSTELLDSYVTYDLKKQQWDSVLPITINGKPRVVMAAAAEAKGSMHILVYGGADGKSYSRIEKLERAIAEEGNDSIKERLVSDHLDFMENHPGFSKEIITFNTVTKKWFVHDTVAQAFPVTALSFNGPEGFYIISGETSPGIRTPAGVRLRQGEKHNGFGVANYIVLALYLLLSLLIGVYFANKQKSTDDYFLGGGRIPWWASGLSVFGTLLSALTFMAIPAKAFLTDWAYFLLNITAILIAPVIAFVFIPFFNKLKMETAYGFLERRFNYFARALGSLSFILFQFGRIGIVLLLPSLAISIVTGIPVETSILIMGILCIAYTTFGGMEAVIWTDVLQVIVLLGGSLVAIVCLLTGSDTSLSEAYTFAVDNNKINIINMDLNLIDSTFWVVFLGGLASALISQGTDQTVVQRYLTSSNLRDAQKTLYTNAVLTLPATFIFFGIGTLLFIFYSKLPERLSLNLVNNDSIFPWYIVNQLPMGVAGLLIAAIFSAAMSSISSSLNSVSTAFCNDFYKHYRPDTADIKLLKIARWTTLVTGVLGVLLALWMANSNIKSLWDQFYRFLGLITGGLGGMFLLGIVTKTANAKGTLIGVFISAVFIWYLSSFTKVNFLMYSFFGLTSCFVSGYLFSLIFRSKPGNVPKSKEDQ